MNDIAHRTKPSVSTATARATEPAAATQRPSRLPLGIPFLLVHLACLGVFVVGWSTTALVVAVVSYCLRGFGITAFYHRMLAHRAFRTSRPVQFVGVFAGASAAQMGPLWWVAHHRTHHRLSDKPGDVHSPRDGFAWSHVLWIFAPSNRPTKTAEVRDLAAYPELRVLDRYPHLAPALFAAAMFALGALLGRYAPRLGTDAWQMLVWGFFVPTAFLYHATFSVNSIAHRVGRRRFDTADDSRNNWLVALVTLGEGWHNNHHRFPRSARQGLGRFEWDPTYLLVRVLAWLRLAHGLRGVTPAEPATRS